MTSEHAREIRRTSPYRGVQRFIHTIIADYAGADGQCWPHQETIAEEAGCTYQYVCMTIKRMVADGVLEVVPHGQRRGHSRGHEYLLHFNSVEAVTSTQLKRSLQLSRSGDFNTVEVPSRRAREALPESPTDQHPAPTAREEEETVIAGQMPEDESGWDERPKKKARSDLTKPGTQAQVDRVWHTLACAAGHPSYSRAIFHKTIAALRKEDNLSYEEIEYVIRAFFTREAQSIRQSNEVSAFFRYKRGELVKETARTRTPGHQAAMDQSDRLQASVIEQMKLNSQRMREQTA